MSRGRAMGPGRLWKRDKAWVLDYRDERGRRTRKSLSTDKRAAERIRTELIHKRDLARAGLGSEVGQDEPLAELVESYLEDLKTRVTPHHVRNVENRLRHVVDKLDGTTVRDLKPVDVLRVRNQAVADGASHRTANLLVDRLRTMLKWASESELIGMNPLAKLRRLPETPEHQRYRRRALCEEEVTGFLAAVSDDDRDAAESWTAGRVGKEGFDKRRDRVRVPQRPLFQALLETAARWNELRLLTWSDVDLKKAVVVLRAENTKARKVRAIPLRAEMVEELRRLRRIHGAVLGRVPRRDDRIFLSPEGSPWAKPTTNPMRIFDRVLERAGIDKADIEGKLDLHAIRHTALTRFARAGVDIAKVQKLAGHSSPALTAKHYLHLNVEDLRAAVNGLPDTEHSKVQEAKEAR